MSNFDTLGMPIQLELQFRGYSDGIAVVFSCLGTLDPTLEM